MCICTVKRQGKFREIILLGDFNGHAGTKVNNQVVGPYGETRINDNGERLIDLCESHYELRTATLNIK